MAAMWRRRPLSSALLSFGLLLGGLPLAAPPLAGATEEPGAGQTPGAPVVAPQQSWNSCREFIADTSEIRTARCATVSVPVDYDQPGGTQAKLAVIRVPATGQRFGALLVNPGGPGASAVDMVAAMAPAIADTDILRHFDLVGFDPRGVGHSTPALRCRTDAEFDAYRRDPMADYSPAGVTHVEQVYRQLAQDCVDRMGFSFLANIGTASVARDMDMVRQALGDDQINYLGYSYGTELGTAYLERFGTHVRAMVLDGAIDPAVSPIEESISQMAGFQTAFNDYAADCARSPACPLGTDSAQWVNRYHALVDPLVQKPGKTSDPRRLSYADATTGTINALYSPQRWKYLTSGLLGLQRGSDAGDLLVLADDFAAGCDDWRRASRTRRYRHRPLQPPGPAPDRAQTGRPLCPRATRPRRGLVRHRPERPSRCGPGIPSAPRARRPSDPARAGTDGGPDHRRVVRVVGGASSLRPVTGALVDRATWRDR